LDSCKTKEKTSQSQLSDKPVISIKKTPCYGSCPAYSIDFYENGIVKYEGTSHVEKKGKYTAIISESSINNLINEFIEINFFSFKDEYSSEALDLPTTYVYFKYNGKEKTIKDYANAPEALKKLENRLDNYRNTLKWEKTINQ